MSTLAIRGPLPDPLPACPDHLALGVGVPYTDGTDTWTCFDDSRICEDMVADAEAAVGASNVQHLYGIPDDWEAV